MARITVRVGGARDLDGTQARVRAATMKAIAQEAIERLQDDIHHEAARTLRAKGVNQYVAEIVGSRGGPGIIVPVRRKALFWSEVIGPRASAAGVGFEPKLAAEISRIDVLNLNIVVP